MSRPIRLMHRILTFVLLVFFSFAPYSLFAAEGPRSSSMDNPLAVTMVIIIGALLLVIVLLAYVVTGAAQVFLQKWREEKKSSSSKTIFTIALLLACNSLFAQEPAAVANDSSIGGLSQSTLFTLGSVIIIELFVIFSLIYFLQRLLAKQEQAKPVPIREEAVAKPVPGWKRVWAKMNSFRSLKEEGELDLGHEYDSIRELDNRLPPWWLYGFYITIIFAVVYLWQHHVSHTAPLSIDEYNTAMLKAEEEKETYLANQKNKVDETNVTMLDEGGVAAGKAIFIGTCAACHGPNGQGLVGPNLTDDYWLHGGSLKSIFKTIKYGVQEKGMKSWKDDYTPQQIAQLASFVKSLHGTKPANAKDPQGELYEEKPAGADSTKKNNTAL